MKPRKFSPKQQKKCIYCGETKPRSEYHVHKYTTRTGRESERLNSACKKCHGVKTYHRKLKNPEKAALTTRNYRIRNRARLREKIREDRQNNPDKWVRYHLKSVYGITLEQYLELQVSQGGKCKVCGQPPKVVGSKTKLHVDHNHETGKVRGLLCHSCNVALGLLKDDPATIRALLLYVENA